MAAGAHRSARGEITEAGLAPKALLRANKEGGNIQLDTETQLTGVPPEAWTYKLGNRSALEWILDQYKDKDAKRPNHPGKIQHLPLCGSQEESHRPLETRHPRQH